MTSLTKDEKLAAYARENQDLIQAEKDAAVHAKFMREQGNRHQRRAKAAKAPRALRQMKFG